MLSLILDLCNILGGFLLAIGLLVLAPRIGDDFERFAGRLAPFRWIVGIAALVCGGYFLIVHLTSGLHVFHFEVVGIAVGVLLLWERLRIGRALPDSAARGPGLLLAVFGVIAMIVGLQGLVTPG
ncbi:hypothetical protein B7G68_17885 [Caulobacter segnis]|uniref:Uncharacterized protein n=2 Tax=Caulobacter segnis TaxID=88688 RepID=D5VN49_CAUST|nr:hypothetical protein [Caulobacter segnis]ADG11922.1 hypothetical protein Cseg_3492 [Caulobacter segnis ATCC 21756]AVQ03551.1 hypothetical protein B7G68_17885 [Caulobacter segnis]